MNVEAASATSADRFHAHYEQVVSAQLTQVNNHRRRTLRSILKWWAILLLPWLALGYGLTHLPLNGDAWMPVISIWSIVALFMLAGPWVVYYEPYRKSFKSRLVGPLVCAWHESLKYSPGRSIERKEFVASGMFRELELTDYEGEDRIDGCIGVTPFRFSEVDAENVTITDDEKKNERRERIFKGLFYVAEFNKHFSGATYVFPDTAQRLLGSIGQSLQSSETAYGELVKLEDPEFERQFLVYSSSQVEARYILSSALMQRISALRARTKRKMRIGFHDSHLYVAIESGKDHFEPRLFRSVHRELFREYWDVLDIFGGIVEELNLNTRIWTKG